MKKFILGFLFAAFLVTAYQVYCEIQLNNPVTSSYQNILVRGVQINPDGNVYVSFKRADTGEAVLVNSRNADGTYSPKANVNFTALANVNSIISQVETYIISNGLIQGSIVE